MGMLGVGAGQPSVPAPNPHPFGRLGWVWAGVSHGFGVVFALFCITTITTNTAPKFFYTQKHFLPSPTLSVPHPMAPVQSTLKRTQADTTIPQNRKCPKSNIPHKTSKLAQPQADKNQQEQRSVDNVHNSGSGSTKHSPMH